MSEKVKSYKDNVDITQALREHYEDLIGTLESEYEVFDKGIDSFIKADEELSKKITGFIESEMKTNEKYKKRLEGKKYEERAKEIAKILEDILGKYEYINENGETVVYNHIEARNLYSEDEFKMHNKVIIKRIEMEDGQYVDMFIDEDTGEEFKRISHVLGPNQQQVKYGMEKNRIYVDLECYSDDTPWEGFKSWGFSAINCLIQDKYDMQLFACFVLSYIDPETSTEIVKSIEIRKEETEKYYRSKSRSQELFNDMQTGYRAVEICGMLMSVSKLVEELPQLLAKGKKHIVNAINFLDECFESVGDIIKESKKVEIPSMDDIVAWFNRATGNGGLQPAIDGVPGSIVDDIDEVKKPQVDKIDGGDGTKGGRNPNLLNNVGKFTDDILESDYQKYLARKAKEGKIPKDRLDWKEAHDYWLYDSPMARGNAFNKKSRKLYPFNEVNLSHADGSRTVLDSYDPYKGEIISRKATDLDMIQLDTYEKYLREMGNKYKAGTIIRSNTNPLVDGQKLTGKQILEIPASNKDIPNIQEYIDLAKNKYNIELRFTEE